MRKLSTSRSPYGNEILRLLPNKEYKRLLSHMETVSLPTGQNIYNHGDSIAYVYFPLDAICYLFLTMENGATIEAGVIGFEGLLGVSVFMGTQTTNNEARVIMSTRALRVKADIIKNEFDKGEIFHDLVLRFIHFHIQQISQTAACNRIHLMEGRFCRWLLVMHDRIRSNKLYVTQEFISHMLGTRRPYVTAAIGILQKKGIINCSRGYIEILDRELLESCACECYPIMREEFNHLYKQSSLK